MVPLALQSSAETGKHRKIMMLFRVIFLLLLIFLYLLVVMQIRERIGPVQMANFYRNFDDLLLYSENGFSIRPNQYDTTVLLTIRGGYRQYFPFLFLSFAGLGILVYQIIRHKKWYALPAFISFLSLSGILAACFLQKKDSISYLDLFLIELATSRGNISLILYPLLLTSLLIYFVFDIWKNLRIKQKILSE